jgi:hypothetical protein
MTAPKSGRKSAAVAVAALLVVLAVLFFVWPTTDEPKAIPDAGLVVAVVDAAAPDAEPAPDAAEALDAEAREHVELAQAPLTKVGRKIRVPGTSDAPKKKAVEETEDASVETPDASEPPDTGQPKDASSPEEEVELGERAKGPLEVTFHDELPWLKPTLIELSVDGRPISKKEDKQGIEAKQAISLFSGKLPIGRHRLDLKIQWIGDSKVFSYLEGYTFFMKQNAELNVREGRNTRVTIEATPKGSMLDDFKNRVSLKITAE